MNRHGVRRCILRGSGDRPITDYLTRVGPYLNSAPVLLSSLSSVTLSSGDTFISRSFSNPYQFRNITMSGNARLRMTPNVGLSAMFIRCEKLIMGATNVISGVATAGESGGVVATGQGGEGSSGGGCGSANEAEAGVGGSDGMDGQSIGAEGGAGNAYNNQQYLVGVPLTWFGNGGSAEAGSIGPHAYYAGAGGTGGIGYAGGGGGGSEDMLFPGIFSGAGGGGGPLIFVCGRELVTIPGAATYANGGEGGEAYNNGTIITGRGGVGGGGVITYMFKKYDGNLFASAISGAGESGPMDGTVRIYEVSHDEMTFTLRTFGQSWNNL